MKQLLLDYTPYCTRVALVEDGELIEFSIEKNAAKGIVGNIYKGKVENVEKLGVKKFAYPINFKNEGFYVLFNLEMPTEEVDAMGKLMNITDGIVRHMFVRK